MSSSTFFIEIQHNPPQIKSIGQPKIINMGKTIDNMENIDILLDNEDIKISLDNKDINISLDENNIDTDKLSNLKGIIGKMNKTSEPAPAPEAEPASEEQLVETAEEQAKKAALSAVKAKKATELPGGSGKRRKTKRNKKKRINKKKRLTKRSK